MQRSLAVSEVALRELADIVVYVAAENWRAADALELRFRAAISELATRAEHYPVVFEQAGRSLRRRVVGSYNIFFTVGATQVEVVRVLHGARDLGPLFGDSET